MADQLHSFFFRQIGQTEAGHDRGILLVQLMNIPAVHQFKFRSRIIEFSQGQHIGR